MDTTNLIPIGVEPPKNGNPPIIPGELVHGSLDRELAVSPGNGGSPAAPILDLGVPREGQFQAILASSIELIAGGIETAEAEVIELPELATEHEAEVDSESLDSQIDQIYDLGGMLITDLEKAPPVPFEQPVFPVSRPLIQSLPDNVISVPEELLIPSPSLPIIVTTLTPDEDVPEEPVVEETITPVSESSEQQSFQFVVPPPTIPQPVETPRKPVTLQVQSPAKPAPVISAAENPAQEQKPRELQIVPQVRSGQNGPLPVSTNSPLAQAVPAQQVPQFKSDAVPELSTKPVDPDGTPIEIRRPVQQYPEPGLKANTRPEPIQSPVEVPGGEQIPDEPVSQQIQFSTPIQELRPPQAEPIEPAPRSNEQERLSNGPVNEIPEVQVQVDVSVDPNRIVEENGVPVAESTTPELSVPVQDKPLIPIDLTGNIPQPELQNSNPTAELNSQVTTGDRKEWKEIEREIKETIGRDPRLEKASEQEPAPIPQSLPKETNVEPTGETKLSPTNARNLAPQVTEALQWTIQNEKTLTLDLSPPELGRIKIEVQRVGPELIARIEVQMPAVQDWLTEHVGQVRDSLSQQGISLERLDIVREPRGRDSGTGAEMNFHSNAGNPEQEAERNRERARANSTPQPARTRTSPRITSKSGLDVTV